MNARSSLSDRREAFEATRALLMRLVGLCDDEEWLRSEDETFSPVGWHFGHVAVFEAYWLLGRKAVPREWARVFNPRENPKSERCHLPPRESLLAYAQAVRERVLERLDTPSIVSSVVLGHEQQHIETIATVMRMRSAERRAESGFACPSGDDFVRPAPLRIPAGVVLMGESDPLVGYDNERGRHEVFVEAFTMDAAPVTNGEWLEFIEAGGYERSEFWTSEGESWRRRTGVRHPSSWCLRRGLHLQAFGGDVPLPLAHPVEGVSAHEADAYARFRGARLPSECEWERAARLWADEEPWTGFRGASRGCGAGSDFLGNVWEWTSTIFSPYPGFEPHPYPGYSVPWFDGRHRVLRGGSWATLPGIARVSFRNWFEPQTRRIFSGLRLVRG